MTLVTAGLMNKQIAGEIEVTEITVKVHRGNLCARWAHGRWRISCGWRIRWHFAARDGLNLSIVLT
jgi:Bacterial regulatory proteins, luxR family